MSSAPSDEESAARPLPAEVFLDTSIPIARLKSAELREKADRVLERFRWKGIASYALLEYGNVILTSAHYLLGKLRELGSLERLRYFMQNRLPLISQRNKRYQLWFGNLLYQCFGKAEATERAERELRQLIRVGTDLAAAFCDEVRDNVRCRWIDQRGGRWRRPEKCEALRPPCRIDAFFAENREEFCQIREAVRALDDKDTTDQLRGFAHVIDEACENPRILRNSDRCLGLADAIIAVEGAQYRSMFTQNHMESRVLCRVFAQLLIYLPPCLTDPVRYHDFRGTTP